MDRAIIVGMVEDYWRAILPAMQNSGSASVDEIGARFEERVNQTASLLPPVEAAAFQQTVDAERERMIAEYRANPVGLKRRLGVNLGVDDPRFRAPAFNESNLARLAVRTAVRATVWDSIWSIFRSSR